MIKIDKQTKEITTDCKTVGEFMTEAAAMFYRCVIIVDSCRYEFHDNPGIRVTDNTPLGSVTVEPADSLLSGVAVLRVTTAPKPKIVKKSGWVNLYRTVLGSYRLISKVYEMENDCYTDPARKEVLINAEFVTTAKIEWEEVVK